jgi:iron uptake system component EfeO
MPKQTRMDRATVAVAEAPPGRLALLRQILSRGLRVGPTFALALSTAAFASPNLPQSPADGLTASAEHYRPIMVKDIDQSLAGARLLRARLAAGDLAGAEKAWINSRVGWERSEVFTSGFVPDLDQEIDAWPNAVLGFHAIEAKLFGAKRTNLEPETDALILNLEDLDVKIHHLDLLPQRLLNGTVRLAYEIGESKAAGGESAFSGTSLDDMRNNVDGIDIAYRTIFAAAVESHVPKLGTEISRKVAELKALISVPDLKSLAPAKLRATSEELIVLLQTAAPAIGLRAPTLEEIAQ